MTEAAYSPRRRTAVVLSGMGTAGAYQAGVLKAFAEAGVKVDVIAGHGPGVANALTAAIDGGARMAEPNGPWTGSPARQAYRWRAAWRIAGFGLLVAVALALSPLLILVVAAGMYAASAILALANLPALSERLVGLYRTLFEFLFSPPVLPTVIPRLVMLAILAVAGVLVATAIRAAAGERSRRRLGGAFWWRLIGEPIGTAQPGAALVTALWGMVRDAAGPERPSDADIGRRYVDVLADNFGQPGFREVLIAVHDLDARRDLVGGVLAAQARAAFEERRPGAGPREAEVVDFTGPQRELVVDFLLGALRLPVAMPAQAAEFPSESYWRGERHRFCDRPELVGRLLDEVSAIGVEQVVLVSPAAPPAVPHGLRPRPIDLRTRLGEHVRSVETAALQEAQAAAAGRFAGVFIIRPDHNPINPFDFRGVYDEASDRFQTIDDLMQLGYEDAYRRFIEPVVAAGEREA